MSQKNDHDGWRLFLQLCSKASQKELLGQLFDLLLTLEEKHDLALRCSIIKHLEMHQESQREIANLLQVSIAKITRGSNALKIVSPKLKKFIAEQISDH